MPNENFECWIKKVTTINVRRGNDYKGTIQAPTAINISNANDSTMIFKISNNHLGNDPVSTQRS